MDCCVLFIYLSPKGNQIILGQYDLLQVYLRLKLLVKYFYNLQYHRANAFHGAHRVCQVICCDQSGTLHRTEFAGNI